MDGERSTVSTEDEWKVETAPRVAKRCNGGCTRVIDILVATRSDRRG
jgi:hypothetical protein